MRCIVLISIVFISYTYAATSKTPNQDAFSTKLSTLLINLYDQATITSMVSKAATKLMNSDGSLDSYLQSVAWPVGSESGKDDYMSIYDVYQDVSNCTASIAGYDIMDSASDCVPFAMSTGTEVAAGVLASMGSSRTAAAVEAAFGYLNKKVTQPWVQTILCTVSKSFPTKAWGCITTGGKPIFKFGLFTAACPSG